MVNCQTSTALKINRFNGYTLLELLITLALISILLVGITSGYKYFRYKNSADSMERIIISMIDYARILSMSGQQSILMTALDNDWNKGVRICKYISDLDCQDDENLLMEHQWSSLNTNVHWHGFQSSTYLLFKTTPLEMAVNGYFMVSVGDYSFRLIVNRLGSVRKDSEK